MNNFLDDFSCSTTSRGTSSPRATSTRSASSVSDSAYNISSYMPLIIQTQGEIFNIISNKKWKPSEELMLQKRLWSAGDQLAQFSQFFCHDLSVEEFNLITFLFIEGNQFDLSKAAKSMISTALYRTRLNMNRICFFPSPFSVVGYLFDDLQLVLGKRREISKSAKDDFTDNKKVNSSGEQVFSPRLPIDSVGSLQNLHTNTKSNVCREQNTFLPNQSVKSMSIQPSSILLEGLSQDSSMPQEQKLVSLLDETSFFRMGEPPIAQPQPEKIRAATSCLVSGLPSLPPLVSSTTDSFSFSRESPGEFSKNESENSSPQWRLPGGSALRGSAMLSQAAKYSAELFSSVVASSPFSTKNKKESVRASEEEGCATPEVQKERQTLSYDRDVSPSQNRIIPIVSGASYTLTSTSACERAGGKIQEKKSFPPRRDPLGREESTFCTSSENESHDDPITLLKNSSSDGNWNSSPLSRFCESSAPTAMDSLPCMTLYWSPSSIYQSSVLSSRALNFTPSVVYCQYLLSPVIQSFHDFVHVSFIHQDFAGRPLISWKVVKGANLQQLMKSLKYLSSRTSIPVPSLYQLYFTTLLETAQCLVRYNHRRKWGKDKKCLFYGTEKSSRFALEDAVTSCQLIVTLPFIFDRKPRTTSMIEGPQKPAEKDGDRASSEEKRFVKRMLTLLSSTAEKYYPSLLHYVFFLNIENNFPFSEKKFLYGLKASIARKVVFCNVTDENTEFFALIPKEYIPFFLGRVCECCVCARGENVIKEGSGAVPEGRSNELPERNTEWMTEAMRSLLTAQKGDSDKFSDLKSDRGKHEATGTEQSFLREEENIEHIEKDLHVFHFQKCVLAFSISKGDSIWWNFKVEKLHRLYFSASFTNMGTGVQSVVVDSIKTRQMTGNFSAEVDGTIVFKWKNPSSLAFKGRDVHVTIRKKTHA